MDPMVNFVILSAVAFVMLSLVAAFLFYHARKQEKEFEARAGKK